MVTMNIEYQGELRTQIIHLQSGNEVTTDAPIDNKGKGEAFSPTDLMSASLGSCMLTIMGIKADSLGITMDNTKIVLIKKMSSSLPRRVSEIDIEIMIPHELTEQHMASLERAALGCPVAQSIHPDLKLNLSINCQ